jgi:hypothetical protein
MSTTIVVAPEKLQSGLSSGLIHPIPPSQLAACSAPTAVAHNSSESYFGSVQTIKFDITILSATISKYNVPYKDVRGCTSPGSYLANYLVTKFIVSNTGPQNYHISSQLLELTDCSESSSFMNMYSFVFPGGPYYKYERCLSDVNEPKLFNCSNMGISAGNFHISTVWIEISDTVATSLATNGEVDLTAHFLPLDVELEAISSPYRVNVTGVSPVTFTVTPSISSFRTVMAPPLARN